MSTPALLDPRGPRFSAGVTTVVLAVVLITGWWWLLAIQAVIFALGAFIDLRLSPYGLLYRRAIAPRLGPPGEKEDVAPVRFAQGVGFAFALLGTIGYLSGATVLGAVATALALIAALLNAAFGYC
ncbi:MAG: DUF4395 domain-containing protein, partial [Sciscionella sp.]